MILNIPRLNQELSTLKVDKEELTKKLSTFDTEKAELNKTIKVLQDEVAALKGQVAEVKKEEAAVVVAVSESVEKKVVQKLATLGVPEGTVKETEKAEPTTEAELHAKFESLSSDRKTQIEFFKRHEKPILNAMRIIHYRPIGGVQSNMKSV